MKEIEFRGKMRNEYTEEWFYGDLLQDTEGHMYIITKDYTPKPNGSIELNTCQSPQVDPETVGQYTGKRDCKANKIYTDDIIKGIRRTNLHEEYEYFKVHFHNGCYMVGNFNMHEFFDKFSHKEVVGNLTDTPELLEISKYVDNDTMLPATE